MSETRIDGRDVLDVAPINVLDTLFDAVARRRENRPFFVRVAWPQQRATLAALAAEHLFTHYADYDLRISALDDLATGKVGVKLPLYAELDPRHTATLADVIKLSDGLLVESHADLASIISLCGLGHIPYAVLPSKDTFAVESPKGSHTKDCIVVWAPQLPRRHLLLMAFSLQEVQSEVRIVCSDGGEPLGKAPFISPQHASETLAAASFVIDASLQHVAPSLELAGLGVPLAVSSTSGAEEFLDGVTIYDPWNHRSIYNAVTTGRGNPPPRVRSRAASHAPTPRVPLTQGPRATCVIRTFNRPAMLAKALATVAAQTYANVEIIVVNDAGPDVSNVVSQVARARLLNNEVNRGPAFSSNRGAQEATGKYIMFLDDDDELFPDHFSVLVDALETSRAQAANADTIAEFAAPSGDEYTATGYRIFLDAAAEPSELYVTDRMGPMSVMVSRDLFLRLGGYDEKIPHADDWDWYLRIAQNTPILHCKRVTALYSIRSDQSNMMQYAGPKIAAAMRYMAVKHPLNDRPVLAVARSEMIQTFEAGGMQPNFPKPALQRQ